jgi:ABC-type Fe3+-siderophore transport system permease subunit
LRLCCWGRAIARLGIGPLRHCRRADYHAHSSSFCPPTFIDQPFAVGGVALGIICSALMTWAIYFSTSFDLRQLMYWMMGASAA